ncbi:MAG: family 10 glycosylhydrolase [Bacteroidales bacterium]|nr:family 10 glycosylhydrolase [Bacteroidales bacterium]
MKRINRSLYSCLIIKILLVAGIIMLPRILAAQYFPKHELRAIWIATVNNIDWPSSPGLTSDEQRNEIISLLDLAKKNNLNTVVFQIRPAADAFYESSLEPWSQWLTGKQGQAPEPWYDPLEFVISECRKRGLDIHAWLNPYRAVKDTADTVAENHITKVHPGWFLTYGTTRYFDPGLQETRNHVASVASDIVRRYDIDAIHMDDYFYPYRIANVSFPDDSSFFKHPRGFSQEQKEEWRRDNVNLIIKQLSDSIKAIKPWVEFGISPFGVWRNIEKDSLGSATRAGVTNYDDLYADILLWQKEGWIDYVTPQLYWHIGFNLADYSVLSEWWSHNTYGCRLYIGQAPYRIGRKVTAKEWRTSREIVKQVLLNRTYPNIDGTMFFSARVLRSNPLRLWERLSGGVFRYPALPPANSRITPLIPQMPSNAVVRLSAGSLNFSWQSGCNNKKFIVYRFRKGKPADVNNPANILLVTSDTSAAVDRNRLTDPSRYFYIITSQSRTNTESEPVYFRESPR